MSQSTSRDVLFALATAGALTLAATSAALAEGKTNGEGAPLQVAQAAPASKPAAWMDRVTFSGYVQGGITYNPDNSTDHINFGHLFTDRADTPLLNQASLTLERPLDPKNPDFDLGFKLQGLYGSDARYTHFFGELDHSIRSRYQVDILEANLVAHLPVLAEGGIDVKAGQFTSPMGAEVISAPGNLLYSHSYIFNFGLPFKNTGVLTTTHLTSAVDLYLGIDTGVNASIGDPGDNNDTWAGQGGIGLNLMDGALTVLALTHIGPENARGVAGVRPNDDLRYLNDVVITWKISDKLTSITDINYIHDDGFKASGGGIAQYISYALSDTWSVTGRGEVWRDGNAFFVGKFPGVFDYTNAQRGLPNGSSGGGKTTYGALTLGAAYKPEAINGLTGLMIRPEVRYDSALNSSKPFDSGAAKHQFTLGVDVVVPF